MQNNQIEFKVNILTDIKDYSNDNIDIIVEYNGHKYAGVLMTYLNLNYQLNELRKSGENINGLYFDITNCLIVNDLSMETIYKIVGDLIKKGRLDSVFALQC